MILKIFTTFDSKAKAFMAPFFMHEDGMATRIFSQAINDEKHQFGKAPYDYTLFKIGELDDSTGIIEPHPPETLGNGVEFLSPKEPKAQNAEQQPIQSDTNG